MAGVRAGVVHQRASAGVGKPSARRRLSAGFLPLNQAFAQPQEELVSSPRWQSHCAMRPGGWRELQRALFSYCATLDSQPTS